MELKQWFGTERNSTLLSVALREQHLAWALRDQQCDAGRWALTAEGVSVSVVAQGRGNQSTDLLFPVKVLLLSVCISSFHMSYLLRAFAMFMFFFPEMYPCLLNPAYLSPSDNDMKHERSVAQALKHALVLMTPWFFSADLSDHLVYLDN